MSKSGHTILVVDDEAANLHLVSQCLEEFGCRILVARDGESALERARYTQPDLILLDVMMPGLDGFATCRRLKAGQSLRDTPVIFMSSLAETQDKVRGFEAGGVDYIPKPFQIEEVRARVKTHLALRTMQKQLEAQNSQLKREMTERRQAESQREAARAALQEAHDQLEQRVEERTAELATAYANLKAEIVERKRVEEEKERLQAQIAQAQKMEALGQLARGIAHDFNNLLTVIQLNTQLMQRQLPDQDPLGKHVREIAETSEQAARLIRQLLRFGRREIIESQPLSLNDTIQGLTPMLHRIIGEEIELKTTLAKNLWPVEADPSQMEQVIVNLVVNARDAMPQGGTLNVNTDNVVLDKTYAALHVEARLGEHVRLTISDTGVGMSAEVKARIFEPFFTTKEQRQGTGLGLAIVFGIVKQNSGHIQVQSQVGQGTTFEIYIPCA